MADTFTEVKNTSYFKRIILSVVGMLLGIVMFFGSFALLYINEGRVNLADVAKTAVVIDSSQEADQTLTGVLVSTTGKVTSEELVGDDLFLNPDRYVALERVVEVYAWTEDETSTSQSNMGGSETTETSYSYKKEWTTQPEDSARFHKVDGHQNVKPRLLGGLFTPSTAQLGIYSFKPSKITLPSLQPINLQAGSITLTGSSTLADSKYVYSPYGTTGSITAPEIGDMRISYQGLRPDFDATIFAKLEGLNLVSFETEDAVMYRLFMSSHSEAIETLDSEHAFMTWILRVIGFVMMWIGLILVFRPLAIVADVIPILGKFTGFITGSVAFLASLILSIATIIVSMVLHSLLLTIASIVVVSLGLWYVISRRKAKMKTQVDQVVTPEEDYIAVK